MMGVVKGGEGRLSVGGRSRKMKDARTTKDQLIDLALTLVQFLCAVVLLKRTMAKK